MKNREKHENLAFGGLKWQISTGNEGVIPTAEYSFKNSSIYK